MFKNAVCPLQCGLPVTQDITKIIVHGAKEHNLKNICFAIPKGALVALTGPSGSGKSSIATDILQKECVRQYLESLGMVTDHIEKAKVDSIVGLSPSIGVSQRVTDFNPRSTVGTKTGILTILRNMFAAMGHQPCTGCRHRIKQPLQDKHTLTTVEVEETTDSSTKKRKLHYFDCPQCGYQLEKLQIGHFSCNALMGACTSCKGAGEIIEVDLSRLLHEEKTIRTGGVDSWNMTIAQYYERVILAASKHYNIAFDPTLPIRDYTNEQRNFLLYGITFPAFVKAHQHISAPKKVSEGNFEGIIPPLLDLYKQHPTKDTLKKYITHKPCDACHRTRLSRLGREVTINDATITEVTRLSLQALLRWLNDLDMRVTEDELPILNAFAGALKERTTNLIDVGLHYLSLDRTLPSLSAGESQRVRLASLLGCGLTGVLYVLDEPTTGLHPHDTAKLLTTMRKIQEAGNTVLIIEHDMEVVKSTDFILDIGPAGGSKGGTIVVSGTPAAIMASSTSSTGTYLTKKPTIKLYSDSLKTKNVIIIRDAHEHNLQHIDVTIPLQQLVVLTGVSGSGKSTLLFDILDKAARSYLHHASESPGKHRSIEGLHHIKRVVTVDQSAIGNSKSTRSNVATYTKLFDLIRDLFASLPAAKSRGFTAATFSFNTSDERCENCNGAGVVEIDMTFMPAIETACPICNGMRFNEALLAVQLQGHHISSILDMTVSEALIFFKPEKKMFAILDLMKQVGLEYLTLGQSTTTLSGGEAQRIKLAAELSKSTTGNTLYLLDEPTTGLHPQEVEKLTEIFKKLVSQGNTVVIIEHNIDVICNADTVIDFGPGGGTAGGTIVATGTPQEIMAHQDSLTGQCLKAYLTVNEL